jgi:MFS family permease
VQPSSGKPAALDERAARRLLLSSSIGTVIEWYDFFAFATGAALVFDKIFFPAFAPATGVLLSLMTYGVGFVTRPLGGVLFGIIGDRYGRKPALVLSLLLMGLCTVAVGLVPSYATIGVAAPVLLVFLRLLQGLAVGGEVGGAVLLVAESMSKERRGQWTAWPQIGGPAGNLAAAGVFAGLTLLLSEQQFLAFGWRIAFLLSGALIFLGVWMRSRVEESPLYQAHVAQRRARKVSIFGVLRQHLASVFGVLLVKAGENALFYVFTTFFVVYVTRVLGQPRSVALTASLLGSAIEVAAIFWAGRLSDQFGRRPVTAAGLIGAAAWSFALFPLTEAGSVWAIRLAAVVGGLCHGFIVGGMSAYFVELFPTSARYTGFSLGYQVASVLSGAVAPIIGVALFERFGSTVPVSLYAAAMALPALLWLARSRETRGTDLSSLE